MSSHSEIVPMLLALSDQSFDDRMKVKVKAWSDPPKAIEVLEVLDWCVHGSLTTSVGVMCLEVMYDEALEREGVTKEDIEKKAHWRTAPVWSKNG